MLVNSFLVAIWAFTGANFFWPAFSLMGWGIGLVFHARDTYWEMHSPRTRSAGRCNA